jgi:hypothetical protein
MVLGLAVVKCYVKCGERSQNGFLGSENICCCSCGCSLNSSELLQRR